MLSYACNRMKAEVWFSVASQLNRHLDAATPQRRSAIIQALEEHRSTPHHSAVKLPLRSKKEFTEFLEVRAPPYAEQSHLAYDVLPDMRKPAYQSPASLRRTGRVASRESPSERAQS